MNSHCKKGHEYSEDTFRYNKKGTVICKLCERWRETFWRYGVTEEDWRVMWNTQYGLCPICSTALATTRVHVDHDHRTNTVRGLLCELCNRGLGQFKDSSALLRNAIQYLNPPNVEYSI